jgi:hypothetical protein
MFRKVFTTNLSRVKKDIRQVAALLEERQARDERLQVVFVGTGRCG